MELSTPRLFPSWRLAYTMCAFAIIMIQLCMSNALNFAILCMVKSKQNNTEVNAPIKVDDSCPEQQNTQVAEDGTVPEGEFSWSQSQEWWLLSSYFYGFMVSQPIAGRLADKFGGKLFLLGGLGAQAAIFMLMPVMARTNYWFSVINRLIQGLLAGFTIPSIYQLYTIWGHPTERAALMSFSFGGYSVGSLIVFPITSILCRLTWTSVFYVIGGAAVLISFLSYWFVYNTLETHPWISEKEATFLKEGHIHNKVPPIPWKQMFTSCPIITFIVTHICHSYGIILLNLILPRYFRDAMHFTIKQNGLYSATTHVGSLVSRVFVILTFARLLKNTRFSLTVFRRIIYCSGNVITILSFIAIAILTCEERVIIVWLTFIIGASTDFSFSGAYWISMIDLAPAFAGLLAGISNSASTVSGMLTPLAIAKIVQDETKEEWDYLFYSMAVAYTLSIIIYGFFGSSEKQEWGDFITKPDKTAAK